MSIEDIINKYSCNTEWSNTDNLYRCKINVNEIFYVSIIAGAGAYSDPQTMLSDFSHYDLYEIAFFDMENKWLKVTPEDCNCTAVTYKRYSPTDTWGSVAPFEIEDAINALLEAWQG
jgi:hypothetical protein